MLSSMFNVQVPLPERGEVFLMNTFSDAQLVVSPDVASLVDTLAARTAPLSDGERETVATLAEHGFLVESRDDERRTLEAYFRELREKRDDLRLTVLTTMQCNFACDYCIQGDHGDHNLFAQKMTAESAARVAEWIDARLDELRPATFALTFFGGEPLLNLPAVYALAEHGWRATRERGITFSIHIITNGLLLTPEVVDRLLPFGLSGVKITLDGDRDTHNRMRPLRGRQGTFDRIIENVRRVAPKVKVAIGGNFDADSVESFPALLDFLREQEFADRISRVNFKPVIRSTPATPKGLIPLTEVGGDGRPLGGACMTAAGSGVSSACDSCHFVDEQLSHLREETEKRGFATADGVHMGPCEIHREHAYTIGPDGALYACPGFAGESSQAIGHITAGAGAAHRRAAAAFDRLAAWKQCGDCAFVPVCAGGCSVAAHTELGDMHAPACHKTSFQSALVSLARRAVEAS